MRMGLQLGLSPRGGASFDPASLFGASDTGALLLPRDSTTTFQTYDGASAADADGDPVGLILDKSKGGAKGADLGFSHTSIGADWTDNGGQSYTYSGTNLQEVLEASKLTSGRVYEVDITVTGNTTGVLLIRAQAGANRVNITGNGNFVRRLPADSTSLSFAAGLSGGRWNGTVTINAVREVEGLHAWQATNDDYRPTLKQAGDVWYLDDDGVDDALNVTFPNDSYTVSRVDKDGLITTQTGQTLSGSTDILTDNLAGYLAINRALTAAEQSDLDTYWGAIT